MLCLQLFDIFSTLVIHVVGNKLDLASSKRAIPVSRTEEYVAKTLGTEFSVHEVSAKDDNGRSYAAHYYSKDSQPSSWIVTDLSPFNYLLK